MCFRAPNAGAHHARSGPQKFAKPVACCRGEVASRSIGQRRIGAGRLQRIAEIFEVPVAALFGATQREGRGGADPFAGLRTPGAVQLPEAYARIGDRAIRRAFLRFAEQVAVTSQRSSRR